MLGYVFGVPMIAFGGWLFVRGLRHVVRSNPERRWPQVEGVILHSEVKDSRDDFGYVLDLSYDYKVDGKTYTSTVLAPFRPEFLFKRSAEHRRRRYTFGARVQVHFDPANPNRAVLEPCHQPLSGLLRLCFGAGLLLFGAVVLLPWDP